VVVSGSFPDKPVDDDDSSNSHRIVDDVIDPRVILRLLLWRRRFPDRPRRGFLYRHSSPLPKINGTEIRPGFHIMAKRRESIKAQTLAAFPGGFVEGAFERI
jgi:hypothetical protein